MLSHLLTWREERARDSDARRDFGDRARLTSLDLGLRFFNRYFTRNPHHGTRSRRMDSSAHRMQATHRGGRKKAVRQGVQVISVLSITARLLLRMFSLPRPGPS